MFVTDELRAKVGRSLQCMEAHADWLVEVSQRTDDWYEKPTYVYAAERALHVAIECSTDAANDVIDTIIMREPGSYSDIIRVLREEDVVTKDWFQAYEPALSFRDKLVHGYATMTAPEIREAVTQFAHLFHPYARMMKDYLGMS